MSDLDIYDPVPKQKTASEPSVGFLRRKYNEYTTEVGAVISEKTAIITQTEEKVLGTLKPVTRFVPVTYDTVKRVSIIALCTYSGVLQGRARAGFRRLLYPLMGFTAGNAACYPKQTYRVSSRVLTTGLPIIASAGKASVEAGSAAISTTSRGVGMIYEKLSEQLSGTREEVTRDEETRDEVYEVEIVAEELEKGGVENETTVSSGVVSSEVMSSEVVSSEVVSSEVVSSGVVSSGGVSSGVVSSEVVSSEVVSSEVVSNEVVSSDASDKIIPVEKIVLPADDVEPITGSLGMGDTEHDDMYSTRSSRS